MNSALAQTHLATVALGLLWIAGIPLLFWEAGDLMRHGSPLSTVYLVSTLGNALVVSSTAVFIANVHLRLAGVARWATRLAALGAVVLVLNVVLAFAEEGRTPISMGIGYADYHGMLSLLVPALVIWHLFMDYIERNAVVGASIMTLATCVIGWEIWLLREAATTGGISAAVFGYYWGLAALVAQVIGYVAFGLAALAGTNYLLGARLQAAGLPCPRLAGTISHWHLQTHLATAAGVGVPVFVVAIAFVLGWGFDIGVGHEEFWATALWLSGVAILYTVFLARLCKQFNAPDAAWCAIDSLAAILVANVGLSILSDFTSY